MVAEQLLYIKIINGQLVVASYPLFRNTHLDLEDEKLQALLQLRYIVDEVCVPRHLAVSTVVL